MDSRDRLMQDLQVEYDQTMGRLIAANMDFPTRDPGAGGYVYYEPADDWFIVYFGPPTDAATIEINDVISARFDPETWKLLGFEVPSVAAFVKAYPSAAADLTALVELAMVGPGAFQSVPPERAAAFAGDLQSLISA